MNKIIEMYTKEIIMILDKFSQPEHIVYAYSKLDQPIIPDDDFCTTFDLGLLLVQVEKSPYGRTHPVVHRRVSAPKGTFVDQTMRMHLVRTERLLGRLEYIDNRLSVLVGSNPISMNEEIALRDERADIINGRMIYLYKGVEE